MNEDFDVILRVEAELEERDNKPAGSNPFAIASHLSNNDPKGRSAAYEDNNHNVIGDISPGLQMEFDKIE